MQDEELGSVRMRNVPFRLTGMPGQIRFTGRALGQGNADILGALGLSDREIEELQKANVI